MKQRHAAFKGAPRRTPVAQTWCDGLQQLLLAETEQAALDLLVAICSELALAPAAGVAKGRGVYYHSVHSRGRSQAGAQLLEQAIDAIEPQPRLEPTPVCLPLFHLGDLIAVVCLGSKVRPAVRRAMLATLRVAFAQTIDRLRRSAEAQLLARLSASLSASRDPSDMVQQVLSFTTAAFGGTTGRVFLFDERAGDLKSLNDGENLESPASIHVGLDGTLAGQVVQQGQGVIGELEPADVLAFPEPAHVLPGMQGLCVPLAYAGRVFGAMMLVGRQSSPRFSTDDMRLLATIGGMMAALIANARLYVRAVRDALTGAYNRGAFDSALEQSWQRASELQIGFTLILLDFDNFKQVNDRFGHTIGDQVLQMATRILWEALRTDDVIFRYGGEEFCVLLAGVAEPPTALVIAERLRAALDCSLVVNELVRVPISASLGVAIHPLHGALKARELLDLADDAAYQAKISGKNRVVLAPLPAPPA